jgi:hypothetical protein
VLAPIRSFFTFLFCFCLWIFFAQAIELTMVDDAHKEQKMMEGVVGKSATGQAKLTETEELSLAERASVIDVSNADQGNTNVTAEENVPEKEELVQDPNTMDVVSDTHTGAFDAKAMVGQGDFHGQAESQDVVAGSANEMAPPPVPQAQDASSETVSITASSISNPALEVDSGVRALVASVLMVMRREC